MTTAPWTAVPDQRGRRFVVTGATSGIGLLTARVLVHRGAEIVLGVRNEEKGAAAAAAMTGPGRAVVEKLDVSDLASVEAFAERIGDVDVLVNNAGRTWGAPIDEFPDKAWPGVMAVNVQAPFRMMQEFLPELEAGGTSDDPARIVNIGSIAGSATTDLNAYSYAASKAALHHLTRQMARDLAPRHINANVVVPGYFATSMTAHLREDPRTDPSGHVPLRRLGQPEDIAGTVVYAASRASAYMTGAQITIDGGLTGCA